MHAYFLCILVVVFFAGNILVGKAINDLPPITIAFIRLAIAFLVLLPIGFRSAWEYRARFMEYKKPFLIMTVTGITFFNTFIYGALQFTSTTNVAVLETMIPAVTVVLSVLFLKEKLGGTQWFGVVLSIFGAVWVVMDGRVFQLLNMAWNMGDAIMLGAIFGWSIYSLYLKKYIHLFPAYGVLFAMTAVSVVILLPFTVAEWLVVGVPSFGSAGHWMGLLYLGIFPSVIAILCYNYAVNILGASKASVFLNFLPVFTMAGAYVLLNESISGMQILGSVMVMAGVILTTRGKKEVLE